MRSKFFMLSTLFISLVVTGWSQSKSSSYQYTVDLTRVVNDKVYVELLPPRITQDEIIFYLPKIVPGTYSIEDYGRFVSELTAYDKKGNKLTIEKLNDNAWKIKNASKLAKLSYWIEDSFDTTLAGPEIFQPAGTNIEEGKNFILNTSGFFGYFEGVKEIPFQFSVIRPEDFYGSSGLIPVQTGKAVSTTSREKKTNTAGKRVDTFRATDYDELIDSPLMYAKTDTAIIKVANTEVLVGSYSPNGKVTAKEIAASIREVLMAQKEYLGGTLPVDKYAFIFYFTDQPVTSYGALEHSYSSFYYMPEQTIGDMEQQLRDFAAHEFFHIVTPLTIHSKEIQDFDFNDPKMSQHLWLYEGVTEYFAGNVQVKYGLITPEDYLQVIREKMLIADQFDNDLSFTDLSKYTLDKYHDQYQNVYLKGALIGLCLDIKLRSLSPGGKYGLRNLLLDLSKKYGKTKGFNDDELFDEITKMTYPEIGTFFDKYVKKAEPLPLAESLDKVGVLYKDEETFEDYSLGISQANIGVTQVDGKPRIEIASEDLNEMGKALGFKKGDVLMKINQQTMPDLGPELGTFIQQQLASLPSSKTLSFTVLRTGADGVRKETELTAPVQKIKLVQKHLLGFNPQPTAEQLALQNAWLKP